MRKVLFALQASLVYQGRLPIKMTLKVSNSQTYKVIKINTCTSVKKIWTDSTTFKTAQVTLGQVI